jgi:hypothetical protein
LAVCVAEVGITMLLPVVLPGVVLICSFPIGPIPRIHLSSTVWGPWQSFSHWKLHVERIPGVLWRFAWAVFWGFALGWFYSGEQLFLSWSMPGGQEAKLTGLFVYCTIILTWLPPLIFSIIVENGIEEHWV